MTDPQRDHGQGSEDQARQGDGRRKLWEQDFPADPAAVARTRAATHAALVASTFDYGLASQLVSELATNAVLHSGSREYSLEISLSSQDCVRVAVIDEARSGNKPSVLLASEETEGNRGLWLVEQLSHAWGVADEESGRRCVWFELWTARGTAEGDELAPGGRARSDAGLANRA